jgi:hypothetical protein
MYRHEWTMYCQIPKLKLRGHSRALQQNLGLKRVGMSESYSIRAIDTHDGHI